MPVIATLVANRRESPALNNIRSPSGLTVIALVSPRFSNLDRHCGREPALAEGVSSVHWFSVVIPNPKTTMYVHYVHENPLLRNPPDDPTDRTGEDGLLPAYSVPGSDVPYHARFDMLPCRKQARRVGAGGVRTSGAHSQGTHRRCALPGSRPHPCPPPAGGRTTEGSP